ncbi:hypothetical protein AVEN_50237-1 [Araneus ventricosus]|uniref:Uncharacterized protein n=1 Tax=Araneus ventricosus TaxID=182803 RepID=A0A4Y2E761_ARAVE|nr:hypothetical protein AVEN_50237-1 [Araneus ventricosus]
MVLLFVIFALELYRPIPICSELKAIPLEAGQTGNYFSDNSFPKSRGRETWSYLSCRDVVLRQKPNLYRRLVRVFDPMLIFYALLERCSEDFLFDDDRE